ncbi:MAG: LysR family transcriptional regulator [Leeuwenhoekiella sp.]|nr:MAG: LysR family transcriptional regulator [Leeuwenhoekiella sp.]
MDRLDAMRVILAVVDAGSLSAGSRKLNAPLPSVSRKVADLERYLGTNLLVRTSRKVQLTDAGRDYVDAARRIIADLDEAERRASGEYLTARGELTVTMPIEFGARHVMPIAVAFIDEHPEITLNIVTSDRMVDLVEDHIDVAIRLGALTDSGLYAVKAGEFRLLTCASPAYLERRGIPQHPRELPGHDGVSFGPKPMFWTFHVDGEDVVIAPRPRVTVNNAASNVTAAVSGAGIARVFDYQLADELRSEALVPILGSYNGDPRPVHIVYPRQGLLPLKVRAFIDWAAPRLRTACTSFSTR